MYELKIENASLETLTEVLTFVESHLEEAGWPLKSQMQVDVAVEEIYVNIVHYAYSPATGPAEIHMEIENGETVSITFIDQGVPFDPTARTDPDVSLSAEDREVGGLGIYMVKKSMDSMDYRREDGRNILTIRKKR